MKSITLEHAKELDQADPNAHLQDLFDLPQGSIYLDGNSLGALPKKTASHLQDVVQQQWGQDLITSWNKHQWMNKPTELGDRIGKLIGANPGQTLVADTTSVNIFKLAAAAVAMRPERRKLVTETSNFATDLYLLQGLEKMLGDQVEVVAVARDKVLDTIDDDTALVLLTHAHYKSGALWDMPAVTDLAHKHGALMLWDLCHSAGAMPVHLDKCKADFAVGCTYKYLNGGPGSPAFLYVAERHQQDLQQPLTGWLGHARPFAFEDHYEAHSGITQAMCGTPAVLANAALECSLDVFDQADLAQLRKKAQKLGDLFIGLVEEHCPEFTLASPKTAEQRGNQVSLHHPEGYAIMQNLIAEGIIGDFRAPDILRFGFAPLYVSYEDIWHTVMKLKEIMHSGSWQKEQYSVRNQVT